MTVFFIYKKCKMESKLIYRYLKRLSVVDWEGFKHFLDSKWIGKSKTYQRYLEEFHKMQFAGMAHTMESFHEAVHPSRDFDPKHLTRQLSLMLDRLFSYLAWTEFRADSAGQQEFLMRSLAKREWKDAFEKEGRGIDSSSGTIRNSSRLLDGAQLELLRIEAMIAKYTKSATPQFEAAIDALEEAYIVTSLDLACKALNVDLFPQKGNRRQIRPHRLPELLKQTKEMASLQRSVLAPILLAIYQLYRTPAEEAFGVYQAAKRLLMGAINHRHAHNAMMFLDLFTHLVNFVARQLEADGTSYRDELLELYHFILKHEVLIYDQGLYSLHFQNIITAFFKYNRLDWVEEFLPRYMPLLNAEDKTIVGTYNLALLHFYRGDYSTSRWLLRDVGQAYTSFEDAQFSLIYQAYVIVMEYACGDYAGIEGRCKNYERWIRSVSTLQHGRKQKYLQFCNLVKKMALLAESRFAIDVRPKALDLRTQLERKSKKNPPAMAFWLSQQLDVLIEGRSGPGH